MSEYPWIFFLNVVYSVRLFLGIFAQRCLKYARILFLASWSILPCSLIRLPLAQKSWTDRLLRRPSAIADTSLFPSAVPLKSILVKIQREELNHRLANKAAELHNEETLAERLVSEKLSLMASNRRKPTASRDEVSTSLVQRVKTLVNCQLRRKQKKYI